MVFVSTEYRSVTIKRTPVPICAKNPDATQIYWHKVQQSLKYLPASNGGASDFFHFISLGALFSCLLTFKLAET